MIILDPNLRVTQNEGLPLEYLNGSAKPGFSPQSKDCGLLLCIQAERTNRHSLAPTLNP